VRRRSFLGLGASGLAFAQSRARERAPLDCGCGFAPQQLGRGQAQATLAGFERLQSGLKVTGMKVFGVSLTPTSDRPYVFCKLETNQGIVGWGEGTLEGKAGAAMACIEDFKEFVVGADPMQVEHIWQSMYVHSFYRAGPVMGSAISAIDQALWDIRGKALGVPVYKLLGGPLDPRGVREEYLRQFNSFCTELERGCREINVDLVRTLTTDSPADTLSRYLATRRGKA